MVIDKQLLDELTAKAKASPRLRMNMDLRNSAEDSSQRMLNAIEPGTEVPIHRHQKTSETVVMLRGSAVQWLYDDAGEVAGKVLLRAADARSESGMTERLESGMTEGLEPGMTSVGCAMNVEVAVPAMNVEKGQWHRIEALESGTVILEMKDGAYEPIGPEDIMN